MVSAALFCVCVNVCRDVWCSEGGRCFMFLGIRWRLSEGVLPTAGESNSYIIRWRLSEGILPTAGESVHI
jgi:hypothetical protein